MYDLMNKKDKNFKLGYNRRKPQKKLEKLDPIHIETYNKNPEQL